MDQEEIFKQLRDYESLRAGVYALGTYLLGTFDSVLVDPSDPINEAIRLLDEYRRFMNRLETVELSAILARGEKVDRATNDQLEPFTGRTATEFVAWEKSQMAKGMEDVLKERLLVLVSDHAPASPMRQALLELLDLSEWAREHKGKEYKGTPLPPATHMLDCWVDWARKVREEHPPGSLQDALAKRTETACQVGINEEIEKQVCSCGGPPGHVPGGIHCKRPCST